MGPHTPYKVGGQCSWLDGCSGGAWTQADHLGVRVRAPNVTVEQVGASRSHLARRGGVPSLFLQYRSSYAEQLTGDNVENRSIKTVDHKLYETRGVVTFRLRDKTTRTRPRDGGE